MLSRAVLGGAILLSVAAGGAAAQSSPEEPFAVVSRGRPLPHAERTVVVLRDSVAPVPTVDSAGTRGRAGAPPATAATPPADSARGRSRPGSATTGTGATGTGATVSRPAGARTGSDTATAPAAKPTLPPKGSEGTRTTTTTPAATRTSARTHEVVWGETWSGIVSRYGVSSAALQAANPEVDPDRLRSGTVLRIPAAQTRTAAPTAGSGSRSTPARRTHEVKPGESLWGIAQRYGVSTEAIRKANDLEGDRVRIGETLVIPGGD